MWELDYKEGWAQKNWFFPVVLLEKTLESLVDYKEIEPVNPKGNQPWIFIERTDAEAPIFWSPDAKILLMRKDPDVRKDWRQKDKGSNRGWDGWMHRWLNGHESEQTPGDGEGQGGLACCSPWDRRESDMNERLKDSHLCSPAQVIIPPVRLHRV